MPSLALRYDPDTGAADLAIENGSLVLDDGLESLVLASLLTDARAASFEAPGETDRRGWWGDSFGTAWGGKLWLLFREKTLAEIPRRAEDYAKGALAWMIADGIAASIDVAARREDRVGSGAALIIEITITRPDGTREALLFDRLWRSME